MQIAISETRKQFPLSYKKIIKKSIQGAVGTFFSAILIWMSLAYISTFLYQILNIRLSIDLLTIFIIFFFLMILDFLYQYWYFIVYYYNLTTDFIKIKKGIITPREITIPYERIQDVYLDQDLLDRILAIYDVHVSTATISSGYEAHIDGLEKENAEKLRDLILYKIKEKLNRKTDIDNVNEK